MRVLLQDVTTLVFELFYWKMRRLVNLLSFDVATSLFGTFFNEMAFVGKKALKGASHL